MKGAKGGDEVIENNAEAAAPAAAFKSLVSPTNRLRFGSIKIAEQKKSDELRPKAGRGNEPKNEPKGQNLVPDYAARVGNA